MPAEPQIIKAADETAVIEKLCNLIETKAKARFSFYRQTTLTCVPIFANILLNFYYVSNRRKRPAFIGKSMMFCKNFANVSIYAYIQQ